MDLGTMNWRGSEKIIYESCCGYWLLPQVCIAFVGFCPLPCKCCLHLQKNLGTSMFLVQLFNLVGFGDSNMFFRANNGLAKSRQQDCWKRTGGQESMANILETISFQPHIFAQEMHAVPAVLAGKIGHLLNGCPCLAGVASYGCGW